MNLYYYLHGVDELERQSTQGALVQLQHYLRSPELNLHIEIRELPREVAQQVSETLNGNGPGILLRIIAIYNFRSARTGESGFQNSDFLLLCTSPGGELARMCKQHSPQALYGIYFPDTNICIVYYFKNPFTIYHEIFHMLGAEDCYLTTDKGVVADRGPTCGKSNCIMQYGITEDKIGDWPFICEENLKRIRDHMGGHG